MKKIVYSLVVVLLLTAVAQVYSESDTLIIEKFSSCVEDNGLPCDWHASQRDVEMFSVEQEEENYFVKIRTHGGNTSIGKQFNYDIRDYPYLSWRWRVHSLPEGGYEKKRDRADSGAGVYVVFKGRFRLNRIIKYVWSTELPEGTLTHSPFNRRTKIIVLRSGEGMKGEWVREKVNVYEDYKRFFDNDPPMVEGIAIMSDGDNTDSFVEADYDKFVASKK
ncbi:hypothetical protein CHISP_1905 [Chitinispirillum alkaliphilum]|nr:hypothetical protein CHISP_1905 [Chitinispirillum alkaliphilum]